MLDIVRCHFHDRDSLEPISRDGLLERLYPRHRRRQERSAVLPIRAALNAGVRSLLTGFTRRGAAHSSLSPTAIAAIARA
jgi:hypothetical protein